MTTIAIKTTSSLSRHAASASAVKHTFVALDGLRGVAALGVVVFHCGHLFGLRPLPNAYLAVDFFFILSGFVIAHAYERKLQNDMTFGSFSLQRLVRLYPMYAFGLALSVCAITIASLVGLPHANRVLAAISLVFGLFFLPTPSRFSASPSQVFPLNGPAWSLSAEIGINFAYAALVRFLSQRVLLLVTIVAASLLVWSVYYYQDLGGDSFKDYASGWARVAFGFPAGVLLYRLYCKSGGSQQPNWIFPLLAVALLGIFALPSKSLPLKIVEVCVVFPAIIWLCAKVNPERGIRSIASWLGEVSYPLYISHIPVIALLTIADSLIFGPISTHPILRLTVYVLTALAAAWLLNVAFDLPIRARLRLKLFGGMSR